MQCPNCKNENRENSNFCRFCGGKLNIGPESNFGKTGSSKKSRVWKNIFYSWSRIGSVFAKIKNKFSYKTAIILVIILLISGGVAFAAPKAKDYFDVNKAINKAKELQGSGNYEAALASVTGISNKWALAGQKEEMTELQEKQKKYIEYKELFNDAIEKESAGAFNEAREILKSITSDFPEYNKVEEKLSELQTKIEEQLKADVEEAEKRARAETVAKKQAEARARAEAEAKRQAEAQAQAEAAANAQAQARAQAEATARARAQAEADAAARAAREAELRRQQEAFTKFVDEVVTIHNSIISGLNYMNKAIVYLKSSDATGAMTVNLQAQTIFEDAKERSKNLLSYRTPGGYTSVGGNLQCAAENLSTSVYYYSMAIMDIENYNFDSADYYITQGGNSDRAGNNCLNYVKSFLTQQGR